MIEHLATIIEAFPGAANQTRCFAHILNLVAKSVLRQFEAPNVKGIRAINEAAKELAAVSEDIDDEIGEANKSGGDDDDDGNEDVEDGVVDDDDDGLQDERDEMSQEELVSHEETVKPIRLVLTKVIQFIFIKQDEQ